MTEPYHIDRACFVVPVSSRIPHYLALTYPYTGEMWIIIGASVFLLGFCMRFFLGRKFSKPWIYLLWIWMSVGMNKTKLTFADDFWKIFGLLTSGFHVGGRYLPVLASGRMFKILSTIYFFLIMVSYRYFCSTLTKV